MKQAEFDNLNPVYEEKRENSSNFKEYGYGYWAKFLLAYPKFLTNGKNEEYYFVSRLSADYLNQSKAMESRMQTVLVGKGYYYFATCDEANSNSNIANKVNYPEDFDGIWTYIYYSYSAEQKKAFEFIKFGSGDFQTVTYEVQNPSTNSVRFTVGGKDNNRYSGFNVPNQVFSLILLVSCNNIKSPIDLIPELITYKLVSNLQNRDPDTKEVDSIVGISNNPQFPQEYALSGWFKWEVPEQQKEWHIILRVKIQQPSHDLALGDRTFAAWVGQSSGGIIHLATYTYTHLEGSGNANVVQNIHHQNRHTEWYFVQFGYSRPQKKATASIQWKESAEKKEQ
ncbi:unnamed protein product (macronuclear) [Paramecium tetraurelia]|uniref:Uncharacterized protein n=1 Tax=Paramecium tetraurelia TaxID=5888 RepID=A0DTD0_PARTE|nr:uncharacterized protein GSPATT00039753001 [Paramecium tetraurelia]CAK86297.1 unnamed protein product [Paramecium tetraurelia]|eukprot:XP_001453694.1 hypothetical protein (macronuclear) [Paramecium tetraurelia strain d4-2]